MGRSEHYYIGERDLTAEHHWRPVEIRTFWRTQNGVKQITPKVICFGGNGSLKPNNANYVCKVAQSLVGIKEPHFQNEIATTHDIGFVGIGYGNNYGDDPFSDKTDGTGSLTDSEMAELVRYIFMPMYKDNQGRLLPETQIFKNFTQITFFAHCHGAREVNNMVTKIYRTMVADGVKHKLADMAIKQLFAVTYAPIVNIICPNLQVVPERDGVLLGGPLCAQTCSTFLERRFDERGEGSGTVAYQEDENTASVIVTNMTANNFNEHPARTLERDENWRYKNSDPTDILPAYGDTVSQAVGTTLAYAIAAGFRNQKNAAFTPRPTIATVLQKVKSVLGDTQNPDFAKQIASIQNYGLEK